MVSEAYAVALLSPNEYGTQTNVQQANRPGTNANLCKPPQDVTRPLCWRKRDRDMQATREDTPRAGNGRKTHLGWGKKKATAEITLYLWECELCDRKSLVEIWLWADRSDCRSHTVKTCVPKSTSCILCFRGFLENFSQQLPHAFKPVHMWHWRWKQKYYFAHVNLAAVSAVIM